MTEQGVGVVRPLPGEGVVAHLNGLLLVSAADQPIEELLQALNETAASGGDGRALARRVAQVLARAMEKSISGEPVTCAVAGPAGGGVAVLVSGAALATVSGGPDGDVHLAGRDALTWTDRLVNGPVAKVELRLPGAGPAGPYARLDGGVVGGAGVECDFTQPGEVAFPPASSRPPQQQRQPSWPPQPKAPEPIVARGPVVPPTPASPLLPGPPAEPSAPQPQPAYPPPSAEPAFGPRPYVQQDSVPGPSSGPFPSPVPDPFSGSTPAPGPSEPSAGAGGPADGSPGPDAREQTGEPRPGDEDVGEDTRLDAAPPEQLPMVYGVDCKNDHFNDPRAQFCAVCGVSIDQRAVVPYKGPRPQLGVLLLDDGVALPLDGDYVLGRDPERASEVQSGQARPARVTSPDGSVSRRHLRVSLNNWDVNLIDLGSVNGTQIQQPGDPNFYDIPPNEPVPIQPGTTVRIGVSRTMRYEAHRTA